MCLSCGWMAGTGVVYVVVEVKKAHLEGALETSGGRYVAIQTKL